MRTSLLTNPLPAHTMKIVAVVVATAVGGLVILIWNQAYADDTYTFLIRGDVVQVDTAEKTMKINSRHTSSAGENDLGGQTIEFQVKSALFYKYDKKMKKVRTTLGAFDVGQEVVVKGAKKSGGNYNASIVIRNNNTVNLRGTLQGHDVANAILEIDIDKLIRVADSKDYRTKSFPKGDRVKVYYDKDSTKFISRDGKNMNPDEVANNNEKITVEGIDVRYGSRFVAGPDTKVTDGRFKF